jgi:uncharacterized protein YbaP (TraB family)
LQEDSATKKNENKRLKRHVRKPPGDDGRFVVARNRRWLPDSMKRLEQGEKPRVVAEAAHRVGKNGLIELLKQRGYSLEQL